MLDYGRALIPAIRARVAELDRQGSAVPAWARGRLSAGGPAGHVRDSAALPMTALARSAT
ncbi:hypothetical protein CFB46_26435 [Burkholderia sp. HI2761]|nr:hypothetical protein [Burkholderia sp. BE24]OXJ24324.1 hypothetical protein CFB46_26435 [Burkholderia sp. HI2761]